MSNDQDQNKGQERNGTKAGHGHAGILIVLVVVLVGAVVGILTFLLIIPPSFLFLPILREGRLAALVTFLAVHIILSTISISLVIALLVVYVKTYRQTKANFALGLVIVLLSLLLQNLLTYPLIHPLIDSTPLESTGFTSPVADIFQIVAYAVFLYLSLE